MPVRYRDMITRLASFLLIGLACAAAAAQELPGDYVLLLDRDSHPLAGSYRIGPDVKMTLTSADGGLPGNPVYLDRAFFPAREAEMLSFYNGRHAYSSDPAAVDVGGEASILDKETLLPPLFKDQTPEREKTLKLTVLARLAFGPAERKLVGKVYKVEGIEPGDKDWRYGDFFHVEALDIVLPANAARAIASVETGKAIGSGDFQALYVEKSGALPDFVSCIAEKRRTPEYKLLAERQRAGVDAFLAENFTSGKAFWADTALYDTNQAMSVYTLCPN